MNTYQKALALLTPREKRRGALVLGMVVIMALLETAGVASILPFLAVLGDPGVVETDPVLLALYTTLGFESVDRFLLALGIGAFCVVIVAAGFRILTTYAMNRFISMRSHSLSERLLETYLRQPYAFFLNRHSGDLAKSILSEVEQVVGLVLAPAFHVIAASVVALALILLLVIMDPWLALGVSTVIGGMYVLVYFIVQGLLSRIGKDRTAANRERFTAAGEALGGIKDIKLLGREYAYLSRFRPSSIRLARHQATSATLSEVPKYLIEAIAVGGILGLALVLMVTTEGVGTVLPILGLYAFAGYKLIPAVQRIYEGFARLRFGASAVDEVYEDLRHRATLAEIYQAETAALTPVRDIALGVPKAEMDRETVARCARMAQVHEFIMQELPNQYDTLVGERGVRLSGGQRQRIGIARALYHNPSVLVFDEATSALDTLTERAVMDAVSALSHQKTIILIAHRLSTVRACDRIFMLEQGRLVEQGTYDDLVTQNERFRAMAMPTA